MSGLNQIKDKELSKDSINIRDYSIDKHNSHTNNIEEEEIYNKKKGRYTH